MKENHVFTQLPHIETFLGERFCSSAYTASWVYNCVFGLIEIGFPIVFIGLFGSS